MARYDIKYGLYLATLVMTRANPRGPELITSDLV